MSIAIGAALVCAGVLVGLVIGPDSEREDVARVDGWLDGYNFARRERRSQQSGNSHDE